MENGMASLRVHKPCTNVRKQRLLVEATPEGSRFADSMAERLGFDYPR